MPGFCWFSSSYFIRLSATGSASGIGISISFNRSSGLVHIRAERIILHDARVGLAGLCAGNASPMREYESPCSPQRFVGAAVQRILIHHAVQPVRGRRMAALVVIEDAHPHFGFGQHFLDVAQHLLGFRSELAVGELHQQLAAFLSARRAWLGSRSGLLHLLVVDHADLLLRFGGLLHGGIEQDEVLVLGFGLRQAVRAAFAIPAVGDGQLGLGQILAGVVGVDQRVAA